MNSVFFLIKADPGIDLAAQCEAWEQAGYGHTNIVVADGGSMAWICAPETLSLPGGVQVLGLTYIAVWADPSLRAAYDSIYPPDEAGNARPFAVFEGMEKEMGL